MAAASRLALLIGLLLAASPAQAKPGLSKSEFKKLEKRPKLLRKLASQHGGRYTRSSK